MRASLRSGVPTLKEISRFPNGPVRDNGSLRWDMYRLWEEMKQVLAHVGPGRLESIGADAWGCDYGLMHEDGALVEPPYTYRDPRTNGVMESVFTRVSRERIYE